MKFINPRINASQYFIYSRSYYYFFSLGIFLHLLASFLWKKIFASDAIVWFDMISYQNRELLLYLLHSFCLHLSKDNWNNSDILKNKPDYVRYGPMIFQISHNFIWKTAIFNLRFTSSKWPVFNHDTVMKMLQATSLH